VASHERRFRLVGADVYQHFPDSKPEYVSGFHPLEFQPMCEPFSQTWKPRCRSGHYKHPLQRFDRAGPFITCQLGYHTCDPNDHSQLVEPTPGIVTHHFQFRDEAVTRRRLAQVYGPDSPRSAQLPRIHNFAGARRLRSADAVYSQRWSEVANHRHAGGDPGVDLRPWSDFSPWAQPRRWYSEDDLAWAIAQLA
jgi:hypothetical protein